ncbi:MAG: sigma factor-like helix-turn-helix DNA-binding protein [Sedimentisphaeraceae bacterium JB056]
MSRFNENTCCGVQKHAVVACRDDIDLIRMRAESVFSGKRLAMIRLYFDRGATCREIAQIAGKSEGQICRIINSLVRRLKDSDCLFFLRHRQLFSVSEQKILYSTLFDALSYRKAAARHRCSIYKVRKAVEKLGRLKKIDISGGFNGD